MKSKFLIVLGLLVVLATVLVACAPDSLQIIQNKGGGDPAIENYVERRNIQWKIAVQDRNNTIEWCTFLSNTGSPLTTVAVLNKMTSGNKRLDPAQVIEGTGSSFQFTMNGEPAGTSHYTAEVPGADGTFGSSNPYEFGFTPEGIDGYFQTNLLYYCSLKPLTWQVPTINLGVDEGLAARQMQAEQILKSGGCIDSALNPVACSTQTTAPSQPLAPPIVPTTAP